MAGLVARLRRGEHLAGVKDALRQPANLKAAIGYYRTAGAAPGDAAAGDAAPVLAQEQAARRRAERPTLYLHGSADGCIRAELIGDAASVLAPGSRLVLVPDAGHFLHLEKPGEVNRQILAWVTG